MKAYKTKQEIVRGNADPIPTGTIQPTTTQGDDTMAKTVTTTKDLSMRHWGIIQPVVKPNDPARVGKPASRKAFFGEWGRYAVFAVHTRFNDVQWFVTDAETIDPTTGLAEVIRQENTFEEAIRGPLR